MIPVLADIAAQITYLLDKVLSKFVDVDILTGYGTTNCFSADLVNASLNQCGEEFANALTNVIASVMMLLPKLLAGIGVFQGNVSP